MHCTGYRFGLFAAGIVGLALAGPAVIAPAIAAPPGKSASAVRASILPDFLTFPGGVTVAPGSSPDVEDFG